jgi:SynChlorMet cassette protein ScmC
MILKSQPAGLILQPLNSNSNLPEYGLSLADGNRWSITGDKYVSEWVEKFAAIMELKKCTSNSTLELTFCRVGDRSRSGFDVIGPHDLETVPCDSDTGWISCNNRTIRIWYHKSRPEVICEVNNSEGIEVEVINMWNALQPVYYQSMAAGGLPFHAALIELEGRGILLAGPGNSGKSTCCRRVPDNWKTLSDDEVLVVCDKQHNYMAHPFPTFSDRLRQRTKKTWNVQQSAPLSALLFLEQSFEDKVIPLGEGKAAILINHSAAQVCQRFWRGLDSEMQRNRRREVFSNACEMSKNIPAFILQVSTRGRFWEKIQAVLGWK